MHGEYKTPGGKLVVVDFDVVSRRLANVRVTGDFFVYPEESYPSLQESLDGMLTGTSESAIAELVRKAIPNDTELLGTSPQGIAIAIRRALETEAGD
ncbi:MAG: biotin--protein ligase [Thermomicrobiales bacterium]